MGKFFTADFGLSQTTKALRQYLLSLPETIQTDIWSASPIGALWTSLAVVAAAITIS